VAPTLEGDNARLLIGKIDNDGQPYITPKRGGE
jgi:hypothetical protein